MAARQRSWGEITGPAVIDLCTYSSEIAAFGALNVPSRVSIGVGGSDDAFLSDDLSFALYTYLRLLANDPALNAFNVDEHDYIVLRDSQEGNIGPHYDVVHGVSGIHTNATKAPENEAIALEALHTSADNTAYFGNFPANTGTVAGNMAPLVGLGDYLGIGIDLELSGTSGVPGATIAVTAHPSDGGNLAMALIGGIGGVLELNSPDFSGEFEIPIDRYGSFDIEAVGRTEDGDLVSSGKHRILVIQNATIESIFVYPPELTFAGPGEVQCPGVYAHFSDGIDRNLAAVVGSVDLTPANSAIVRVNTDRGTIQGVRTGNTHVAVEFAGYTVDLPIEVHDGDRLNNPPVAVAGGPETFCGGEAVCLDATESYDMDDMIGDVISYAWDLDGDGGYDDSYDATPCFVPTDGSRPYAVWVRVTDSAGTTSEDVSVLLPEGGLCQSAPALCMVGQGGSEYADFERIEDIDANGAGGFHVLAAPLWSGNVRIVSFDRDCGFIGEFVPPYNPHGLAAGPDGTIYIANPSTVRNYLPNGTELASMPLPELGSDRSYSPSEIQISAAGMFCIGVYRNAPDGHDDYEIHMIDGSGALIETVSARNDIGIDVTNSNPIYAWYVAEDDTIYYVTDTALYRGVRGEGYVQDLLVPLSSDLGSCNGVASGPDGAIYLANFYGVLRFMSDGTYDSMRHRADGQQFSDLQGIAVDCANRVIVANAVDYACVITFDEGGIGQSIPVIDEGTVLVTRTYDLHYGKESWEFTWETDVPGDPASDRVVLGSVTYPCYDMVEHIDGGQPDFRSLEYIDGVYRHTLRWDGLQCVAPCNVSFVVESGVACYRAQSGVHVVKVKYCLSGM